MTWLALVLPSLGAVDDADLLLATDSLALGLAPDGSVGNEAGAIGMLWDPDGPEGPEPVGGDLVYQGYVFEAWAVAFGATTLANEAPYGGSDLPLSWEGPFDDPAVSWLRGQGGAEGLQVELVAGLSWQVDVAWFAVTITAEQDLEDLWVARTVDPDPDTWVDGSFAASSRSGDGYAVAEGAWDARALALVADGGIGGLCAWCSDPAEVVEGAGASGSGDDQLGVAVEVGDLPAGGSATVVFAYGLALGADAAVALALSALDDWDLDGATVDDCDDHDPAVGPAAGEVPDGIDNDCDGAVDEGTMWADDDGDGWSEAEGDCDDADAAVQPGDCAGDSGWLDPLPDDRLSPVEERLSGCGALPGGGPWWLALLPLAVRRRR